MKYEIVGEVVTASGQTHWIWNLLQIYVWVYVTHLYVHILPLVGRDRNSISRDPNPWSDLVYLHQNIHLHLCATLLYSTSFCAVSFIHHLSLLSFQQSIHPDLLTPPSASMSGPVVWLLPDKLDSCRVWGEDEHTWYLLYASRQTDGGNEYNTFCLSFLTSSSVGILCNRQSISSFLKKGTGRLLYFACLSVTIQPANTCNNCFTSLSSSLMWLRMLY